MRVAIVYNEPTPGADAAEADVLEQVSAVAAALDENDHEVLCIPCSLNLAALDAELRQAAPDVVFNLVEALGGTDRLTTLVPMLLDARGIRYTGAGAMALAATADKVSAKTEMLAAGLPTPEWFSGEEQDQPVSGRYIVKARSEHASIGMDDSAITTPASSVELTELISCRTARFGSRFFAERFIPGREFNLALLCREGGVEVLPPAEIDFSALGSAKPHIVGYAAKWSSESFEYQATPRRFDFPQADTGLLERLHALALDTWRLFGLRGYARVDFRVDEDGEPWILEINPNPCLSPDAGFAVALATAGIGFSTAVARMLHAAATE